MLFNSYEFIFLFLPVAAALYFLIGRWSHGLAALWLALASLFFPVFYLLASWGVSWRLWRRRKRRPGEQLRPALATDE